MIYIINGNIFDFSDGVIVHCISNDWELGAGIAKEIESMFNIKSRKVSGSKVGEAYLIDNVCNLITKERYWHKPTYDSFTAAILDMTRKVSTDNIIYLPYKIACGLDRLNWDKVYEILDRELNMYDTRIIKWK